MLFVISCIKVLDTPDFSVFLVVPREHSNYESYILLHKCRRWSPECAVYKSGYTPAPPAGALQPCLNPIWICTFMCVILNAFN